MSVAAIAERNSSPLSLSKSATTTRASLLRELQKLWDEIGESETERDKILLQLEQECLDIYRTKVERSRKYKAELQQSLAEFEAEIVRLTSALGERVSVPRYDKMNSNLKHQISTISPTLESLMLKRQERVKEISELEFQIAVISAEIAGTDEILDRNGIQVDEVDLTTKKLEEMKSHLHELQYEKNLRLQKVSSHISGIHELSVVMSLDFKKIMAKIHPSFVDDVVGQSKGISNEVLAKLTSEMNSLKQEKQQRLLQAQKYGRTLAEFWSLMDTPVDERKKFDRIMCLVSSTADEVVSPGSLSVDVIEQTEFEIERLNVPKVTKMREIILQRQTDFEQIYAAVHMDLDMDKARQLLVTLIKSESNVPGSTSSGEQMKCSNKDRTRDGDNIKKSVSFLPENSSDTYLAKKRKLQSSSGNQSDYALPNPSTIASGEKKRVKTSCIENTDLSTRKSFLSKQTELSGKGPDTKQQVGTSISHQYSEVTRRPGMDASKWLKLEVWEEKRLHEADEKGTLVVLENLDPSFAASEVEDIVWHVFRENVKAKMIPCTAFSSPLSGLALVMFKTKEAADKAISKLMVGSLVLGDGRPIVGRRRFLRKVGAADKFVGHLKIDRTRTSYRQREEWRNAVSTSHFSQGNTIESEMAIEWCALQEKSNICWKALLEVQAKEMEALRKQMKIHCPSEN